METDLEKHPDRIAFSVPEAARRCGVSPAMLWKLIQHGKGPCLLKIGRRTLVTAYALDEWVRRQQQLQAAHGN
jgi:predicted DNA-binding transcriptional regulator AlpA